MLNSVILMGITLCFVFVMDSFVAIAVMTAVLGATHQAWFAIVWTLMYELFNDGDAGSGSGSGSGSDAVVASSYFFFSAGIASLVVPTGMSAILSSAEISAHGLPGEKNEFILHSIWYLRIFILICYHCK